MNLSDALRAEHSKAQALRIATFVGQSTKRFSNLVSIVTGDDLKLSQRAAWAITCCAEANPKTVQPFLGKLLQNLSRTDLHDAVKRNTMKVVAGVDLPDEIAGLAADTAFRILSSPEESIAARAHSMTILERLCLREPLLADELQLTIENQLPYESSPGFHSKARRVLKTLERL